MAIRFLFRLCVECVSKFERLGNERGSKFSSVVAIDVRGRALQL